MTRRPIALATLLTAAALVVAAAGPALAFRQPDPTPLTDKAYRHPDLYIGNLYKVPTDLPGAAATRAAEDLAALGIAPEHARIDRRSDRWGMLLLSQPLIPGRANELTWSQFDESAPERIADHQRLAWDAFARWIADHRNELRVDPAELLQAASKVTVHRNGDFLQIYAARQIGGVPVRDSYLTAVVNSGNLVLFGAINWADVALPPLPVVGTDEALDRVLGHAAPATLTSSRGKPTLEYIPLSSGGVDPAVVAPGEGLDYRLAWVVRPSFASDVLEQWEALVDARTGELLAFEDKANYASTRRVIGGVFPVTNDGVSPGGTEVSYPMPFADISVGGQEFFTDAGGNLQSCVDGTITSTLSGRYVSMTDNCGAVNESTAGDVLDLELSGGTDCTVPAGHSAGDTHATRTGFYELTKLQEMSQGQTPNSPAVFASLPAEMNVNANCNAMGGAGGVTFFTSGGGCSNTGELAGVFDHEWGHYMDALDANPGISSPGEGIADIYASLRLNTSCIGFNFRPGVACSGYGDPCVGSPACSGVRDIDWANRASGAPHDIAWIDANCGSGGSTPCGGSTHCEGAIYAESVWDLWNRDLQSNYSFGLDQAREVAARLTYLGGQLAGNWYNCVDGGGTGDGCNADGGYLNYLAADDDDADLTNGTPHMQAIFDAFDRHDIACVTPTVQDSGCAGTPTVAPTVTPTALDRGAHLSWGAVAGASSYRVFRTEGEFGCDFGKELLTETTDLSYTDTDGLANGREYYYQVMPMGAGDSCYGTASSCTTVIPTAGANLAVQTAGHLDVLTGDNDPFLDNCENARVYFTVTNIGTGAQTDVRAASITSPSHPALDASIDFPATYSSSLAACGQLVGWFDFRATSLAFDDTVEFEVQVTSDELEAQLPGQFRSQSFSFGFSESDLQGPLSQTFDFETDLDGWTVVSGTFNRIGGGGGNGTTFSLQSSGFADNACDRTRSPLMAVSSSSTLSLWNNYDIEPLSGGTWYDRANVAAVGTNGSRTVVNPSSGRPYNADSSGPGNYTGCNEPEEGWADVNNTWGTSDWDAGAFGMSVPGGQLVQLEVTYGTDGALANRGFWFDEVTVTDVSLQVTDTQSNSCTANNLIFADGFASGDAVLWSSSAGGP